jgi:tetratricopeptide (TPR) repeat protein
MGAEVRLPDGAAEDVALHHAVALAARRGDDRLAAQLTRLAPQATFSGDMLADQDIAFGAHLPRLVRRLCEMGEADAAERLVRLTVESCIEPQWQRHWLDIIRCGPAPAVALALCEAPAIAERADALLHKGYILFECGRFEDAFEAWNAAALAKPMSREIALLRAAAARRIGRSIRPEDKLQPAFDPADGTFEAKSLDPARLSSALSRFGCAFVRGLFDPERLAEFAFNVQQNLDNTEALTASFGRNAYVNEGYPLYFASEPGYAVEVRDRYKASYPDMLRHEHFEGFDLRDICRFVFSALHRTRADVALRDYLAVGSLHLSPMHSLIRNMTAPPDPFIGAFHQDARVFGTDMRIVTMWFPLPYRHGDSPSLEIVPFRTHSFLPSKDGSIDQDIFEPAVFWRPEYELGDAVLFSGLNAHRSYASPGMGTTRISIDVRFCADLFPGAVHQGDVLP